MYHVFFGYEFSFYFGEIMGNLSKVDNLKKEHEF